jgi:hypothetical protein
MLCAHGRPGGELGQFDSGAPHARYCHEYSLGRRREAIVSVQWFLNEPHQLRQRYVHHQFLAFLWRGATLGGNDRNRDKETSPRL